VGEPADWNLARRLVEAGVRFPFLNRVVTTVHYVPRNLQTRFWLARTAWRHGYVPG